MKSSPLQWIRDHMLQKEMTPQEHTTMRSYLLTYATQHPVKSGLFSPYFFTSIRIAATSATILLVTLIGVSTQAQQALPYQKLYPVKIWIEDFQSGLQKTPQEKIAFEMGRITKRFQEASTLAVHEHFDTTSTELLQEQLIASRDTIRTTAQSLAESHPTVALQSFDKLATSFTSNGKILATLTSHTGKEMSPLVLAAHETAQQINTEKQRFEKIIITQEAIPTPESLETQMTQLAERIQAGEPSSTLPLEKAPITPVTDGESLPHESLVPGIPVVQEKVSETASLPESLPSAPLDISKDTSLPLDPSLAPGVDKPLKSASSELSLEDTSPEELLKQARQLFSEKKYKETFLLLQHIEQRLDERDLTHTLEKTYQISTQKTP